MLLTFLLETIQDTLVDSGYVPQTVIRMGIRRLLAERIAEIKSTSLAEAYERKMKYVESLRRLVPVLLFILVKS